jgi:acyl-CoA synthetase (AMP-forming)/AMP-acid ligase II
MVSMMSISCLANWCTWACSEPSGNDRNRGGGAVMWLHDALDYWTRAKPNAEFGTQDGVVLSYADASARVDRIAGAMAQHFAVGERVAVLSRNSIDMIPLYYAASKAGVVPVPLNYRLAPVEMEYIVHDSSAVAWFTQDEYAELVEKVAAQVASVREIVNMGGGPSDPSTFDGWLGAPLGSEGAYSRRHHEAMQIYTSGTTGRPKGAVVGQAGLFNMIHQWRMMYPVRGDDRVLVVVPL